MWEVLDGASEKPVQNGELGPGGMGWEVKHMKYFIWFKSKTLMVFYTLLKSNQNGWRQLNQIQIVLNNLMRATRRHPSPQCLIWLRNLERIISKLENLESYFNILKKGMKQWPDSFINTRLVNKLYLIHNKIG